MKIKNIALVLTLLSSYLMVSFCFIDPVNAGSTTIAYGMESSVTGNQVLLSESDIFYTENGNYNAYSVTTGDKYAGTKSFLISANANGQYGFMNLSYGTSSYLTNLTFWVKKQGGSFSTYIYFYNKTLGVSNIIIGFYLKNTDPTGSFYLNDVGTWVKFESQWWLGLWATIGWRVENSIGDMGYYDGHNGAWTTGSSCRNATAINEGYRIDCIKFINVGGGATDWYDDFNFVISSSYTEEGEESSSDFSQYNILGKLPVYAVSTIAEEKENRYDELFTGELYGIDIPLTSYHENWAWGYNICINGFTYTPDLMYNITIPTIDFEVVMIRFDFSSNPLVLDNEKIQIDWYSALKKPSGYPYSPMMYGGDVDGDGDRESKKGTVTHFNNGLFDGSTTDNANEFCFLLYYLMDAVPNPENPAPYGYVNVFGNNMKFNTSGSPLFYLHETVSIAYGVTDLSVLSYVKLYKGATEITSYGFPLKIIDFKGVWGYIPLTVGNYTVNLSIAGSVTQTRYFDVIENPSSEFQDYYIYSLPPMTFDYGGYNVYYTYTNPSGYDGAIALFDSIQDTYDFHNNIYYRNITGNATDSSFYYKPANKNYFDYWQLFVKVGSIYIAKGEVHTHVKLLTEIVATLQIDYGQRFGQNAKVGTNITVYGNHPYAFQNVYVMLNNMKIQDVGEEQTFSFRYAPVKTGIHIFSLVFELENGSKIFLAENVSVSVYSSDTEEEGGGGIGGLPFSIDPPYSYFAGILIIIIFTLSPFLVVLMVKRDNANLNSIPQFLYMVMAIIGFVVTIIMDFFPAWSILVVVTLSALILLILWKSGKLEVGGEE